MLPDVQWVVFIWVITFSTFSHQPSLNSSQHHLDSTSKSKEGELVAGGCEGHWKAWGLELTHLACPLSGQWPYGQRPRPRTGMSQVSLCGWAQTTGWVPHLSKPAPATAVLPFSPTWAWVTTSKVSHQGDPLLSSVSPPPQIPSGQPSNVLLSPPGQKPRPWLCLCPKPLSPLSPSTCHQTSTPAICPSSPSPQSPSLQPHITCPSLTERSF